jgi:hypothetical protein
MRQSNTRWRTIVKSQNVCLFFPCPLLSHPLPRVVPVLACPMLLSRPPLGFLVRASSPVRFARPASPWPPSMPRPRWASLPSASPHPRPCVPDASLPPASRFPRPRLLPSQIRAAGAAMAAEHAAAAVGEPPIHFTVSPSLRARCFTPVCFPASPSTPPPQPDPRGRRRHGRRACRGHGGRAAARRHDAAASEGRHGASGGSGAEVCAHASRGRAGDAGDHHHLQRVNLPSTGAGNLSSLRPPAATTQPPAEGVTVPAAAGQRSVPTPHEAERGMREITITYRGRTRLRPALGTCPRCATIRRSRSQRRRVRRLRHGPRRRRGL